MSDLIKVVDDDIEVLETLVKRDQMLAVLNMPAPANWVKIHPIAKDVKYLPIDKIELLLTKLFQDWYVEVLREGQLLNSVFVAVRLFYRDPITQEYRRQDGLGAVPIKTQKGKNASDMASILNDAIQTGLPAAETEAIKDAAHKIGKLFGKDLNRKDTLEFTGSYGTSEVKDDLQKRRQEKMKEMQDEANN